MQTADEVCVVKGPSGPGGFEEENSHLVCVAYVRWPTHSAARCEWLQKLGQNIAHRHNPTATNEKINHRESRRGHLGLVIACGWQQASAAAVQQRSILGQRGCARVILLLLFYFRWFRRPGVRWESAMWFNVRNDKRNPVPQAGSRGWVLPRCRSRPQPGLQGP